MARKYGCRRRRRGQVTDTLLMVAFFALTMFLLARWALYYANVSDKARTIITMNNIKDAIEQVCTNKRVQISVKVVLPQDSALLPFSCDQVQALSTIGPIGGVTKDVSHVGGLEAVIDDCQRKGESKKNAALLYIWKKDAQKILWVIQTSPEELNVEAVTTYCVLRDYSGEAFLGGRKQSAEVGLTQAGVVYTRPVSLEA